MSLSPRALDQSERDSIRPYVRGALIKADCLGSVPTPLDDVNAALSLARPEELFQLDSAPEGLRKRISRLRGRVLGAFAVRERVIFLDRTQSQDRVRFAHGHELGHATIPWHKSAYFGDDAHTLAPETKLLLEAEANSFSSELLFQLDDFNDRASSSGLSLAVPLQLASVYETSRHAAIRKYVQDNRSACALVIFGRYLVYPDGKRSLKTLMAIESKAFGDRFGPAASLFPQNMSVETSPLAEDAFRSLTGESIEAVTKGEVSIHSDGHQVPMRYEVFYNGYCIFVMIAPLRKFNLRKQSRVLWTPAATA